MHATGYSKPSTWSRQADRYDRVWLVTALVLFCCVPNYLLAQERGEEKYNGQVSKLFDRISTIEEDSEKRLKADSLLALLNQYAEEGDIFRGSLRDARYLGQITTADSTLKMLTWNIVYSDGTNHFYNISVEKTVDGHTRIYRFEGERGLTALDADSLFPAAGWYGALYYDIEPFTVGGIKYYLAIGLDLGNMFTNSKVIEVIRLAEDGMAFFGEKLLITPSGNSGRMLFHYSGNHGMMLRFNSSRKMLVFDHLSPSSPRFEGIYQYYGPDFSYDGFELRQNGWVLVEDIDLRNDL